MGILNRIQEDTEMHKSGYIKQATKHKELAIDTKTMKTQKPEILDVCYVLGLCRNCAYLKPEI